MTDEQAGERIAAAVEAAQQDGTMPAGLGAPATTEEAMGRPGGNALGTKRQRLVPVGPAVRGAAPSGDPAWVASFGTDAGPGQAQLCVYAWEGGSALAARRRC